MVIAHRIEIILVLLSATIRDHSIVQHDPTLRQSNYLKGFNLQNLNQMQNLPIADYEYKKKAHLHLSSPYLFDNSFCILFCHKYYS